MKLAIGTVQFGIDYGVTNQIGKTSADEVKKILGYAKNQKVLVLDTSPAYGESEEVLGKQDLDYFNIITKTAYINSEVIESKDIVEIEMTFRKSLLLLDVDCIYGLFVHHAGDLNKVGSKKLYDKLVDFKTEGLVKKIGVSVYDLSEVENLYSRYSFDMIQIPINVLDQRLDDGQILKELKRQGVEIYARSIFLQGVLLNDTSVLPNQFKKAKLTLNEYFSDIEKAGISKIEGALKYIHEIKEIDYAVIGVNNLDQLKEIQQAFECISTSHKKPINFKAYSINDEKIIDPRKW